MSVMTIEGVVENGLIRLEEGVRLPDETRVYVVVPDLNVQQVVHAHTPRLAHPEDAVEFSMEIIEDTNASL